MAESFGHGGPRARVQPVLSRSSRSLSSPVRPVPGVSRSQARRPCQGS
ncbi:hypothetical protein ACVDG3_12490 [Meridianimarinicoccus sp. RP-17]